jgi:hypothetical protein
VNIADVFPYIKRFYSINTKRIVCSTGREYRLLRYQAQYQHFAKTANIQE